MNKKVLFKKIMTIAFVPLLFVLSVDAMSDAEKASVKQDIENAEARLQKATPEEKKEIKRKIRKLKRKLEKKENKGKY